MNAMGQEQKQQSFFIKYKKWIVTLSTIWLLPTILVICAVIVSTIYSYNKTYYNSYNGHILSGFKQGFQDAPRKDRKSLISTPWSEYETHTLYLKKTVVTEQKEYLLQFPESDRGIKLAEMRQQGIELPTQKQLKGRFTNGLDFYADYVSQQINRSNYNSDKEYNEALEKEGWKLGYAEGYREGIFALEFSDGALKSFQGRH